MTRIYDALRRNGKLHRDGWRGLIGGLDGISTPDPLLRVRQSDRSGACEDVPGRIGYTEQAVSDANALLDACRRSDWADSAKLLDKRRDDAVLEESFRTLRSRLYKMREKRTALKTILISSAVPGEGKTFVVANLARALIRQSGRRVLLIDSDLRCPQLFKTIGGPMAPGLSEYLQGKHAALDAVRGTPVPNLYFVPPGEPPSDAAELLTKKSLQAFLRMTAPLFDWVILDSPPILAVSDALMMADCCDGAIIVVAAGATAYDLAVKACQELQDVNLLGVVLNRAERLKRVYGAYLSR